MLREWLYLSAAIVLEVIGTTSMKLSEGFKRPLPTLVLAVCYLLCFTLLAQALKRIEVGVAYAIWSGVGTALIAMVGVVWFKDSLSTVKLISLGLIILGVVGLNLGGGH